MDDTRVFARTRIDAQQALIEFDHSLRKLHLNTQSAKTKIYEGKEIQDFLFDSRLDKLNDKIDELQEKNKNGDLTLEDKNEARDFLTDIYKKPDQDHEKIYNTKKAFSQKNSRLFRRSISLSLMIKDNRYINILISQFSKNPAEIKFLRLLGVSSRKFPNKKNGLQSLFSMIKNGKLLYTYQRGQLLKSFRYLKEIEDEIISYCKDKLRSPDNTSTFDYYERMEACYLLSRILNTEKDLESFYSQFKKEKYPQVKASILGLLLQFDKKRSTEILKSSVNDSNIIVSQVALNYLKYKKPHNTIEFLKYLENYSEQPLLCDHLPYLYAMSATNNVKTKKYLRRYLEKNVDTYPVIGIRSMLSNISLRLGDE